MPELNKVAFVGSGLIGAGLALNCITHGVPVAMQTRRQIDLCKSRIAEGLEFFTAQGIISPEEAKEAAAFATYTTSIEEAVTGADIIQESGPDSLELKQELIAEIERYAPHDAVIASSTSSQLITNVFAKAEFPERGMGGHPYLPAYIIPLIEITKGEKTSDEYVSKAKEFYSSIGKEPVVLNKEVVGFIANRFQSAIHREAVELVERGVCSVEDADKALVYSVGLRWSVLGQYLTMHLGASPEGIGHFLEKYHIDISKPDGRLSDMAAWTVFPDDWCQKAEAGIKTEIENRTKEMGQDMQSIEAWRDKMLVATLRLHGKL